MITHVLFDVDARDCGQILNYYYHAFALGIDSGATRLLLGCDSS